MYKTVLKVEGMMCGMCEAHMNDLIRQNFTVKKVTSSVKRGETVVLSETLLDEETVRAEMAKTGYQLIASSHEECENKKRFSLFGKNKSRK